MCESTLHGTMCSNAHVRSVFILFLVYELVVAR